MTKDISRLSPSPATEAPSATSPPSQSPATKGTGAFASEAPSATSPESSPTTAPSTSLATDSAPFTEGEETLVHLEDGLIYLGVVVEVEEEQGQCLVRFGDCTERWSSLSELQRLDVISDDECSPTSTPEHPGQVDTEQSSEIPKEAQTGDKKFSCSYCDYLCSGSTALKRHMRIHTGEKPYSCTHCDFSCSHSSNLTRHMRIHNGEKPHSCPQCDCSFAQSTDLKRHMKVHTGEKPYGCTKCANSCSQSSNFLRDEYSYSVFFCTTL